MSLTVKEVHAQTDLLKEVGSDYHLVWVCYPDTDVYDLSQEDGCREFSFKSFTPVESFSDGTILIDGVLFRAYVAQQVKFEPTKD